jgi:hypothetical protein
MAPSRLILALFVSLRAVLVYGEAASAASAELTWRELLPVRPRPQPRPRLGSAAAPAPVTAAARRYA